MNPFDKKVNPFNFNREVNQFDREANQYDREVNQFYRILRFSILFRIVTINVKISIVFFLSLPLNTRLKT